jgi:hypothetical protein
MVTWKKSNGYANGVAVAKRDDFSLSSVDEERQNRLLCIHVTHLEPQHGHGLATPDVWGVTSGTMWQ